MAGVRLKIRMLSARSGRSGRLLAVAVDIVIAYLLWQLLSAANVLPAQYFPTANEVIARAGELLSTPAFWNVTGMTMRAWAIGLSAGVLLGIVVGIALGSSPRAYDFCRVVIETVRTVPPVVLIPVALLVLGPSLEMKLVLILQATFWIMLIQAIYGVRAVDPMMLQTARSFRISRWRQFFVVRLPGALPLIVTGLRIAASFALIATVVAELVGGAPGIGNDVLKAVSTSDEPTMYALILLVGVIGVLVNIGFRGLERMILFWHPAVRRGA